ncbi:MAG: class I SAM-dependent methyltransferase [Devosia sp.]|nr:class I SAM-dependent methyltransferase [Devosia sp.]
MRYERIEGLHPEMGAGGFTAYDGTVAFYARVDALLTPQSRVLDFGAGRGWWMHDETCDYRKRLRDFRGRVAQVYGCDVDEAVLTNPSLDRAFLIEPGKPLQLADGSVDVIVADYVMEHVEDPASFAYETARVLAPGGWLCARTPSKYHYVSMISRLLPSGIGDASLAASQPNRKKEDVFPAFYRLNTLRAIDAAFPAPTFRNCSYVFSSEPQYHFGSPWIYRGFKVLHALLPATMKGNLSVFIQKRDDGAANAIAIGGQGEA